MRLTTCPLDCFDGCSITVNDELKTEKATKTILSRKATFAIISITTIPLNGLKSHVIWGKALVWKRH